VRRLGGREAPGDIIDLVIPHCYTRMRGDASE
jgi:hypothetical protein